MNALYVTVSIPLLLVLAGFNHAHGLTTFGKSTPQNQPNTPLVKAKQCTLQTNCSLIKNTTCLRGACLCGDNHPPNNGECTAQLQGPNHICTKNEDCVDNADCFAIKDLKLTKDLSHLNLTPDLSICRCQEGYTEVGATCGGDINLSTLPVLLLAIALFKVFN
ncbi:oogenesis-related protein sosie isoform X1 [Rhynchophorus ferrugineus]|uniref:oogenesis-related protein sosie isoform X1 n=1 Tax=Rhynchophorus ferrugineus TaxID=354439 RepID=UPI003FCDE49F